MPTYTYQCKSCEHTFDLFHAISAQPKVKCPECKGACRRLIGTGAGVIFKGSGFYETDYKKGNGKTSSTSGKSGGSSSESKSESTSTASSSSKKD